MTSTHEIRRRREPANTPQNTNNNRNESLGKFNGRYLKQLSYKDQFTLQHLAGISMGLACMTIIAYKLTLDIFEKQEFSKLPLALPLVIIPAGLFTNSVRGAINILRS